MPAMVDTHKIYTDFTENGFEPKQAEALIRAVQSSQDQFATKQDIELLRGEIETSSARLEAKIADLKSELSTKIAESKNAIWMAVFLLLVAQIASHFWK
jgi:hypothetical protein